MDMDPTTRRRLLRNSVVGLGAGTALAGCQGNNTGTTRETTESSGTDPVNDDGEGTGESGTDRKTTLRIATPAEQQSMYPPVTGTTQTWEWMHAMYNSLLKVEYDQESESWSYVPDLAEEYEYVEESDGNVVQLTLRDDVTFHNGDELDAELVKTEIEFWMESDQVSGNLEFLVNQVSIDDSHVVNLHVDEILALFEWEFSATVNLIANPYVREERGFGNFATNPEGAGTGPYQFSEYNVGSEVVLESYDDYHEDGVPEFEELVIKILPEGSTRYAQLQTGDLDLDAFISFSNFPQAKEDPDLVANSEPANSFATVLLNHSHPDMEPVRDKRVRRAMSMVIDRNSLSSALYQDLSTPVSLPAPEGTWWHYPDLHEPNLHDEEEAQRLMEEAGYADGFEIPAYHGSSPFYSTMGEVIRSEWQKIGIDLQLEPIEYGTMWSRIGQRDYHAAISRAVGHPDPDVWLHDYVLPIENGGAQLVGDWRNEEFIELVMEGRRTLDRSEREEIYRRCFEIWADEMPFLAISQAPSLVAHGQNLEGYWHWPRDYSREALRDLSWEG